VIVISSMCDFSAMKGSVTISVSPLHFAFNPMSWSSFSDSVLQCR
jgi:hypothetical protein